MASTLPPGFRSIFPPHIDWDGSTRSISAKGTNPASEDTMSFAVRINPSFALPKTVLSHSTSTSSASMPSPLA